MRQIPPPVFSRRSFLFFILLAPAGLSVVFAIILALQYKQFQDMVSPAPVVDEFAWTAESRQSLDTLLVSIRSLPDTLRLSPADLTVLAAASPAAQRQGIRFRVTFAAADSQLIVETTQRVDALSGRFAWIFKRIAPVRDGWLNSRLEGYPERKEGRLSFFPRRGFLNGTGVPRTALTKRGGLSVGDFLDPSDEPRYREFLAAVDTVVLDAGGNVLIVRDRD